MKVSEEALSDGDMAAEVNVTGRFFCFCNGASLLLFYAFAMRCINTLAITKD
jgi:ferrous iron transport protein B